MRHFGWREFRRRKKRGKQLAAERERELPPIRQPSQQDLNDRATLEKLIALVMRDVERSMSLKVPWRTLSYDEWIRETDELEWLFLSIEEEGATEPVPVFDEVEPEDEDDPFWVVEIGGTSGPRAAEPEAEVLADLASTVQDHVIDHIQSAWPRCPGHTHPANAVASGQVAVWVCPTDGRQICPVGELNE